MTRLPVVRNLRFVVSILAFLAFLAGTPFAEAQQLPVVPGLYGWGTGTPAGRGGQIMRVTNLNASGPGSFRAAAEASGPRIVLFEVSGTIVLNDWIRITDPFITIAGQTAPSPGITIRGAGLRIMTHDVLVQHIRIRVGDLLNGPWAGARDAIEILSNNQDCYNIVIDHVSASWAIDEIISVYVPNQRFSSYDITIAHSIISEALMRGHPNPNHQSDGLLIGSTNGGTAARISFVRNILAHNNARNPTSQGAPIAMINNLVWDWGGKCVLLRSEGRANISSIIGNVFLRSSQSSNNPPVQLERSLQPGSAVYLEDNEAPGYSSVYFTEGNTGGFVTQTMPEVPPTMFPTISSAIEARLLERAGARPLDRDAVDQRVAENVRLRRSGFINSQSDVGGWPVLAENVRPLIVPSDPHGDHDGDGYTNIEEWLHIFSDELDNELGVTSISDKTELVVKGFAIDQNYPNPFNPATTINYAIQNDEWVNLTVFNLLGQPVATLVDGYQSAGEKSVVFDATDLSAGAYLYRMTVGD
ncbi:MAG: T9SS type A sorting domain-containing protein, partial [Ignavibacteria bacterium]|nr:T9SS type A sorting domain-containing protein [Ignavibacteria bacterium]